MARFAVARPDDPSEPPPSPPELLFRAVSSNNAVLVRTMLSVRNVQSGYGPQLANASFGSRTVDTTPLHRAVTIRALEIAAVLLKAGADSDGRNGMGETPLERAAESGSSAMVSVLLRAGAEPSAAGKRGRTPLHAACDGRTSLLPAATYAERHATNAKSRAKYEEMLKSAREAQGASTGLVADGGADGIEPGSDEEARAFEQCVSLLLRAGAVVDTVDADGRLPLHLAARKGNTPVVMKLLDAAAEAAQKAGQAAPSGPSYAARARSRRSSIASIGETDDAQSTASRPGRSRSSTESAGMNPHGNQQSIQQQQQQQQRARFASNVQSTGVGIQMAPKGSRNLSRRESFEQTLQGAEPASAPGIATRSDGRSRRQGADEASGKSNQETAAGTGGVMPLDAMLNLRDAYGHTPLHHACRRGRTATASALVRTGFCDPLRRDYIDWTAVHWAAYAGHEACISVLCSYLGDEAASILTMADRGGGSLPIFLAARQGHTGCISVMLRHNTPERPIARADPTGRWPEHVAAAEGHYQSLQALVAMEPSARRTDLRGRTPLHAAVASSRVQCLHVLIHAGYDINATCDYGRTPLHYSALSGSSACASVLIGAGADVSVRDTSGRTALDVARKQGAQDIAAMLVQAGTLLITVASPGDDSKRSRRVADEHIRMLKSARDKRAMIRSQSDSNLRRTVSSNDAVGGGGSGAGGPGGGPNAPRRALRKPSVAGEEGEAAQALSPRSTIDRFAMDSAHIASVLEKMEKEALLKSKRRGITGGASESITGSSLGGVGGSGGGGGGPGASRGGRQRRSLAQTKRAGTLENLLTHASGGGTTSLIKVDPEIHTRAKALAPAFSPTGPGKMGRNVSLLGSTFSGVSLTSSISEDDTDDGEDESDSQSPNTKPSPFGSLRRSNPSGASPPTPRASDAPSPLRASSVSQRMLGSPSMGMIEDAIAEEDEDDEDTDSDSGDNAAQGKSNSDDKIGANGTIGKGDSHSGSNKSITSDASGSASGSGTPLAKSSSGLSVGSWHGDEGLPVPVSRHVSEELDDDDDDDDDDGDANKGDKDEAGEKEKETTANASAGESSSPAMPPDAVMIKPRRGSVTGGRTTPLSPLASSHGTRARSRRRSLLVPISTDGDGKKDDDENDKTASDGGSRSPSPPPPPIILRGKRQSRALDRQVALRSLMMRQQAIGPPPIAMHNSHGSQHDTSNNAKASRSSSSSHSGSGRKRGGSSASSGSATSLDLSAVIDGVRVDKNLPAKASPRRASRSGSKGGGGGGSGSSDGNPDRAQRKRSSGNSASGSPILTSRRRSSAGDNESLHDRHNVAGTDVLHVREPEPVPLAVLFSHALLSGDLPQLRRLLKGVGTHGLYHHSVDGASLATPSATGGGIGAGAMGAGASATGTSVGGGAGGGGVGSGGVAASLGTKKMEVSGARTDSLLTTMAPAANLLSPTSAFGSGADGAARMLARSLNELDAKLSAGTGADSRGDPYAEAAGHALLHLAVALGNEDYLERLLDAGGNRTQTDVQGRTALHWAARLGRAGMVRMLAPSLPLTQRDKRGLSPLHLAAQHGHLDTVKSIVAHAKSLASMTDTWGATPLHWAAGGGWSRVVHFLLESGAYVHALDFEGRSPLHWAAATGEVGCVRVLIRHGADPGTRDDAPSTSLRTGMDNVLDTKVPNGDAVHGSLGPDAHVVRVTAGGGGKGKRWQRGRGGHGADGVVDTGPVLLPRGGGHTPIHHAVFYRRQACLEALLARRGQGAVGGNEDTTVEEVLVQDNSGFSVIHYLAMAGDIKGLSIVATAVRHEWPRILSIGVGENLDAGADSKGRTPLHLAALCGQSATCMFLASGGARSVIDVLDENDDTALHLAAAMGHEACVFALLKCGSSSSSRRNKQNWLPVELAAMRRHTACVVLLLGPAPEDVAKLFATSVIGDANSKNAHSTGGGGASSNLNASNENSLSVNHNPNNASNRGAGTGAGGSSSGGSSEVTAADIDKFTRRRLELLKSQRRGREKERRARPVSGASDVSTSAARVRTAHSDAGDIEPRLEDGPVYQGALGGGGSGLDPVPEETDPEAEEKFYRDIIGDDDLHPPQPIDDEDALLATFGVEMDATLEDRRKELIEALGDQGEEISPYLLEPVVMNVPIPVTKATLDAVASRSASNASDGGNPGAGMKKKYDTLGDIGEDSGSSDGNDAEDDETVMRRVFGDLHADGVTPITAAISIGGSDDDGDDGNNDGGEDGDEDERESPAIAKRGAAAEEIDAAAGRSNTKQQSADADADPDADANASKSKSTAATATATESAPNAAEKHRSGSARGSALGGASAAAAAVSKTRTGSGKSSSARTPGGKKRRAKSKRNREPVYLEPSKRSSIAGWLQDLSGGPGASLLDRETIQEYMREAGVLSDASAGAGGGSTSNARDANDRGGDGRYLATASPAATRRYSTTNSANGSSDGVSSEPSLTGNVLLPDRSGSNASAWTNGFRRHGSNSTIDADTEARV